MRSVLVAALVLSTLAQATDINGDPPAVLTLEEAIQTADAHQPSLRFERANTAAADARVRQATAPLPQITGNAGYQRRTANFSAQPGIVPLNGTARPAASFDTVNYFSASVTASQLIYDFGQTWGVLKSAKANAAAQREVQDATILQAHLDVRTAFFAARAQKSLLEVARTNLANAERHQKQIEGFVQVGTRPQIDLAQAKTDSANARAQLINAENGYEIGKARLNQAMGVEQSTAYDIAEENMPPVAQEDGSAQDLVARAYRERPEIRAQDQRAVSSYELIASARGGYFPSVGVSTTFSDVGTSTANSAWNWNAQAFLTWNIFDGLGTPARTAEAQANYEAAQAQLDTVRLQIRLEVEQQRWGVRAAKESLVAAKEAEVNARERLSLAEGRYQTGVGSVIELGDSQLAYTSAAAQRVQAEYNLSSARASLLKALGVR